MQQRTYLVTYGSRAAAQQFLVYVEGEKNTALFSRSRPLDSTRDPLWETLRILNSVELCAAVGSLKYSYDIIRTSLAFTRLSISGNEAFKTGLWKEAIEWYSRAIDIDPDNKVRLYDVVL